MRSTPSPGNRAAPCTRWKGRFITRRSKRPTARSALPTPRCFASSRGRPKFDVFVSYGFANPWGHYFDRWGQNFVADASGGANYFGTAFSGQVDYPHKHGGMKQFLKKQWRPTSGCELVSSRHFPDDAQGNYLLNNCIGFQGTLHYKMRDEDSGFAAEPVEPLLQSTDPNFRPVDFKFGPDGALYVVDWFNPLIGHMQHSIRDPNRDNTHGRIWRITYKNRPLAKPPKIAGAFDRGAAGPAQVVRRSHALSRPPRAAHPRHRPGDGGARQVDRRARHAAIRNTGTTCSKRCGCISSTTSSIRRC